MEHETPEGEAVDVAAMTSIRLPIFAMKVALACASEEANRLSINGIHVHVVDGEYRIVATDGHRFYVHTLPVSSQDEDEPPEWAARGVTIPYAGLKERLNLLEKLECSTALVSYASEAPFVEISDDPGHTVFKVPPVGTPFPEYQRIIDQLTAFEAREVKEMSSVAYDAGYLKSVAGIAKMLDCDAVRIFGSTGESDPSLITFHNNPNAMLILMPMQHDAKLGVGVQKVLQGAVNGTVGALRAHQTRLKDKLDEMTPAARKRAEVKIAAYDERIAAVLNAAVTPALPAAEQQGEESEAQSDALTEEEPVLAKFRRGLTGQDSKQARTRFIADINARLSADHDGLTIGQLADGVPVDSWYDGGLTVETAAKRCLEWRRPALKALPAPTELQVQSAPVELRKRRGKAVKAEPATAWAEGDVAAQVAAIAAIEPGSLTVVGDDPQPETENEEMEQAA